MTTRCQVRTLDLVKSSLLRAPWAWHGVKRKLVVLLPRRRQVLGPLHELTVQPMLQWSHALVSCEPPQYDGAIKVHLTLRSCATRFSGAFTVNCPALRLIELAPSD